jgi:hypothetical protein
MQVQRTSKGTFEQTFESSSWIKKKCYALL